jgi:diaminobutyrate-2-oxoglutarate transaminase
MDVFERFESEVRSYIRGFPDVFTSAKGARLQGRSGREYIDFFAGAGALNYGHNDDAMKRRLVDYLAGDGILHSLDMATAAKESFLTAFHDTILAPRGMPHRMLFPAPSGANAVEVALKLVRKATGRRRIVSFENSFHGMTLGTMAVSGGAARLVAPMPIVGGTTFIPFDGAHGPGVDTLDHLERLLSDVRGETELPAACIVETVQAEGGINVASADWLRRLQAICRASGMLLIVDDIQVGCGRTGPFFSFEPAGLDPDIVCLSKSLSGLGLPMAMVLVKPDCDSLAPGEHSGTFRGFNPAFITATEALRFWRDDALEREVTRKAKIVGARLDGIALRYQELTQPPVRGRGLIQGLPTTSGAVARRIAGEAFARGLVMETCGPERNVLKILCPLTIADDDLVRGLDILDAAVAAVAAE